MAGVLPPRLQARCSTIPHGTGWCSSSGRFSPVGSPGSRSTTSSARSCTSRCVGLAVAATSAAHVTSLRLRRHPSRSRSSSTGESDRGLRPGPLPRRRLGWRLDRNRLRVDLLRVSRVGPRAARDRRAHRARLDVGPLGRRGRRHDRLRGGASARRDAVRALSRRPPRTARARPPASHTCAPVRDHPAPHFLGVRLQRASDLVREVRVTFDEARARPSVRPSRSWNTSTWPSHAAPAPMPIVGTVDALGDRARRPARDASSTIAKRRPPRAPARRRRASCCAFAAVRPCTLKPPSCVDRLRRQADVAHHRDARGDDRARHAQRRVPPPSSLTTSAAASLTKRPALRTASSSETGSCMNGMSPTTSARSTRPGDGARVVDHLLHRHWERRVVAEHDHASESPTSRMSSPPARRSARPARRTRSPSRSSRRGSSGRRSAAA